MWIEIFSYDIVKPTLEQSLPMRAPQGLHNPRNPYWEEWDVRRYAYWSVFAGAAVIPMEATQLCSFTMISRSGELMDVR